LSCILCLVFLELTLSGAESAFIDRGGVRPMGMGGAFVALADDTSAIMFNPAGLGQIEKAQIAAAYDRLYAGLGDEDLGRGFVSYVQPSRSYGAFALNLALLHTPLYKEASVTFGYGRSFGSACLGVNTKGLFANFKENVYTKLDPLFSDGRLTSDLAFDLGILWRLTDSVSFGLAALNVNQPNMALGENEKDRVPYVLQTGMALKLGSIVPTIDLTYRNKKLGDERDINIHVGMESWFAGKRAALRAGVNRYDMAVGASYIFSRGKNVEAQLDYAFRYPLTFREDTISSIYGSHQFSLDVRFEGIAAAPSDEAAAERIERRDTRAEADELMRKMMDLAPPAYAGTEPVKGELEEAVELGEKILKMEFDDAETTAEYHVEAHMQVGGMLTRLSRFDEALTHFQSAAKIAPRDPRTHYELGILYKQYGDRTGKESWYNKAIIEFERVRLINPKSEDASAELEALYGRRK